MWNIRSAVNHKLHPKQALKIGQKEIKEPHREHYHWQILTENVTLCLSHHGCLSLPWTLVIRSNSPVKQTLYLYSLPVMSANAGRSCKEKLNDAEETNRYLPKNADK